MKWFITTCILIIAIGCQSQSTREYPTGVKFNYETIVRKGNFGDNWCQTWAADDNIYTMMDDGNGWWGSKTKLTNLDDWEGSMFLQISGNENFSDTDVKKMSGWPKNKVNSPMYAYGTISVDGIIYVWVWKSEQDTWYHRPVANRLLYTPDYGQTFYRWNGQEETEDSYENYDEASFFFFKEDPKWKLDRYAYAFNWIAFCQNGKDNSLAKDSFIYMYSPEQYNPRDLNVIRVNKHSILDKREYEYFKNWNGDQPEWTRKMEERGANLQYPEKDNGEDWLWASWYPDVVYNSGLDLYIMVSYGVSDSNKSFWDGWCGGCKFPASLGFWYAENPWGPWHQFYYTEHFYADRENNITYGFKLNPKWISNDGKTMHLIWSDAGDDHSTNYKWNQIQIELITK